MKRFFQFSLYKSRKRVSFSLKKCLWNGTCNFFKIDRKNCFSRLNSQDLFFRATR